MSKPVKYYWKDNKGKLCSSWGIELTIKEKYDLAKKNNELIRMQTNAASK